MPGIEDLVAQLYRQRAMQTMADSDAGASALMQQLQARKGGSHTHMGAQYQHVPFGTHEKPAVVPPAAQDDDLNRRARAAAHDQVVTGGGQADLSGLDHTQAAEVIARQLHQQRMITDGQRYGIDVKPQPPTVYGADPSYGFTYGNKIRTQVGDVHQEALSNLQAKSDMADRPYNDFAQDEDTRLRAEAVVRMNKAGALQRALALMSSAGQPFITYEDDADLASKIVPKI